MILVVAVVLNAAVADHDVESASLFVVLVDVIDVLAAVLVAVLADHIHVLLASVVLVVVAKLDVPCIMAVKVVGSYPICHTISLFHISKKIRFFLFSYSYSDVSLDPFCS